MTCLPRRAVRDRLEVLARWASDGDVLDLGVCDARPEKPGPARDDDPELLFRRLAALNPRTTGVDVDAAGVERLARAGLDVVCADVETMDLGRRFALIVAGELIEHLENPGRFLRNAHRHATPDGVLAVSTPNPFDGRQRHKIRRYGRPDVHADHTCWFDPVTLDQLLRRTGWDPFEAWWIRPRGRFWRVPRGGWWSQSFLMLARPRHSPR